MSRREHHTFDRSPQDGQPDQVAVTVISCLVILVVFILIALLS